MITHIKKIMGVTLFLVLLTTLSSCGTGPVLRGEGETNVITNITDGEVDVDINSAVNMKFSIPVNAASVNSNSFFIVESPVTSESISFDSIIKSTINPSTCDPSNAITGTITQIGSGACGTEFELTPNSSLKFITKYVICVTNGISLCDPDKYGAFNGFQESFTTVSDSETTYSVGGTINGLEGTVVLQNNATDNLTITENGNFTFATEIEAGAVYKVTVLTQPNGQTCTITNSTGNAEDDVTDVLVTCSANTYTVGGSVTGLDGVVVLQNNETDDLTIETDCNFVFLTPVAYGAEYDVTIKTNPAGQTCSVAHGSGTMTTNVTNVAVTCDINTYDVTPSGTHVTIDPDDTQTIAYGGAASFDVTADGGYARSDTVGGTCPAGSWSGDTYTTGSIIADCTVSFSATDITAPTVDSTIPVNEAEVVSIDTTISVTFSEAMNTSTVTTNTDNTTCNGSLQVSSDNFTTCVQMTAGDPVASNGNKTFTLTPSSSLDESTTYKIRVTTDVEDVAGNPLESEYTQATGFTTEDITAPTVSSTNPANGTNYVSTSTTIAVTFDEAMDTSTITTNTAGTTCSGSFQVSSDSFESCIQMSASPVASNGDKTFTITPASALTISTTYKIRVTTDATDVAGNHLASTYTTATGFTTIGETKIIRYLSSAAGNANFGGVAGADAICQTAYGETYKALVVANTGNVETSRVACTSSYCATGGVSEHIDWVLEANRSYVRPDGTYLGTTNGYGIFASDLTNTVSTSAIMSPATGICTNPNWTVGASGNCSNWTSASSNRYFVGNPIQTSIYFAFGSYSTGGWECSQPTALYCVEQ